MAMRGGGAPEEWTKDCTAIGKLSEHKGVVIRQGATWFPLSTEVGAGLQ